MMPMRPYWWQEHAAAPDDVAALMRRIEALLAEQELLIAQLRDQGEERGCTLPTTVPPPPQISIKQAGGVSLSTLVALGLTAWGVRSLFRGTPLAGDHR